MRWSTITWILLVCCLSLMVAGILTAANPAPQVFETQEGAATIYFAVDRTRFVFPSGCATAEWRVEGIREVAFYDEGVTGEGQRHFCTGDFPRLRVVFADGIARTYRLERDVLMLHPFAGIAGIAALVTGSLLLYQFQLRHWIQTPRGQYATALLITVGVTALFALYTRAEYITVSGTLDAAYVRETALYGWLENPNQTAPWAYRPITPLAARAISDVLGQPLEIGFSVLSFMSLVAQLVLVFAFARHFGADFRASILVMVFTGLAYYNLRYSLADIYRPDTLAYPLMLLGLLTYFQNRTGWCILICCIGILTREFLAIPALLLGLKLTIDLIRKPSRATLGWLLLAVIAVGAVVILPRTFIPVVRSAQIFDPQHNPDAVRYLLIQPLTNVPRNVEFLAALVSYLLPTLLLITPERLRRAWAALAGYQTIFVLYTILVLALTMYGGSGIQRYITYLFVVQAVLLAIWLKEVTWGEWVVVLFLTAAANRVFWMVGVDPFGFGVLVGDATAPDAVQPRLLELALYCAAVFGLRVMVDAFKIPLFREEFRRKTRSQQK